MQRRRTSRQDYRQVRTPTPLYLLSRLCLSVYISLLLSLYSSLSSLFIFLYLSSSLFLPLSLRPCLLSGLYDSFSVSPLSGIQIRFSLRDLKTTVRIVPTKSSSSRGGKYSEEDAKVVIIQILNVVSFCHLQGVVHRDLKPEVD